MQKAALLFGDAAAENGVSPALRLAWTLGGCTMSAPPEADEIKK
jgi:hypothetical protein